MDFAREISGLSAEQASLLEALLREAARQQFHGVTTPRAVPIQTGEARLPLHLVHGSGGQVLFLHALARHISPAQPLHGIEAAMAETGTPPSIAHYVQTLRAAQPHGPYRLGGYSAGCPIAFEVAVRLQQAGEKVAFLLLIDPVAVPSASAEDRPTPHERLQRRFEIAMLAGVTPLSPAFSTIEQVNRDIATLARHFCPAPFDGRIHLLHGTRGAYVPSRETLQNWGKLAGGGLVSAAIEADHFEILRDPHAMAAGAQIQTWLDALA